MIRFQIPAVLAIIAGMTAAVPAAAEPALDPLRDWARSQVASGEAAAVVIARIDGDTVTSEGFGHRDWPDGAAPDGDTQFQIGSITKVFTHLLLAEAVAQGRLSYDQSLDELLPDDFDPANPQVRAITLAQLATHTSGLPRLPANLASTNPDDPYAGYDEAALWAGLATIRAGQPLGRHYGYSNLGTGVLGQVLAANYGESYFAALSRQVIEPLGLERTGAAPDDNHAVAVNGGRKTTPWTMDGALAAPAGGLWSSAADVARLVLAYLGNAEHGLDHDLADDLRVTAPDADGTALTRVWHVDHAGAQPIYWHNGGTGSYWSFVGFRPDSGQGVVVLTSGDAEPTAAALTALGQVSKAAPESAPADAALAGQYAFSDSFGVGVWESDGRLFAQATGQGQLPLHPIGDDWYALHEVDASLRFVRGDDGTVQALELAQGGITQTGRRTGDVADARARADVILTPEELAEYEGRYVLAPGMAFTIRKGADALEAQLTGQPFLPVFAAGDDRFFYRVVDASLQFKRNDDGRVDALTLHQGGIVQRAERVTKED